MSHDFVQRVAWQGGRDGSGSLELAGAGLALSIPKQLNGPGAGTNPEELMLSALGACFSMTLGLIAARAQPALRRVETEVHGKVEMVTQPKRGLRFAEIRFVPHLWLASDQPAPSPEALRKLCEQAEAGCFITQTVKGGVGAVVLDDPQVHQA
jgi:peroxiredoxin-like protein